MQQVWKYYLSAGPEWDSFSALEFHALDRPTFFSFFFVLAFSVPPLRFLLSTFTYYFLLAYLYFIFLFLSKVLLSEES